MLNKNDPLIGAVQEVMKKNQAERDAVRLVNEKFGVADRKALPHEKQSAWDATYKQVISEGLHPNQQKLDVHEPEKDKLTAKDFKMLRAKKKPMEEENVPKIDPYAEGQASSISTVAQPKKEVTPADQSALKKKIMSIKEANLEEKAVSKAQHRFFGLVRGIQKGKAHGSAEAEKAAASMSASEVRKFAKTKEKGLPEKVSEEMRPLGNAVKTRLDPIPGSGGDAAKPGVAGVRGGAGVTAYDSGRQVFGQTQYGKDRGPVVAGGKTDLQPITKAPPAPGVARGRALQAQRSASALGGFGANKTLPSGSQGSQKSTGLQIGGARPGLVAKNTPTAPKAAAASTRPAAAPKAAAPTVRPMRTAGASTKDATLMARAKAGGGQKLSKTFSGKDRLAFFAARNKANK
jgi:hypothetical protein